MIRERSQEGLAKKKNFFLTNVVFFCFSHFEMKASSLNCEGKEAMGLGYWESDGTDYKNFPCFVEARGDGTWLKKNYLI